MTDENGWPLKCARCPKVTWYYDPHPMPERCECGQPFAMVSTVRLLQDDLEKAHERLRGMESENADLRNQIDVIRRWFAEKGL